jgi:hypothetical protein
MEKTQEQTKQYFCYALHVTEKANMTSPQAVMPDKDRQFYKGLFFITFYEF